MKIINKIIINILIIISCFSIIFSSHASNNEEDDDRDIRRPRDKTEIPPDESFIDLSQTLENTDNHQTGYTLSMIIKKILYNSPMIESSRSMEEYYHAKIKQIKAEREPALYFETAFLPVPNIPTPNVGKTWLDTINFNKWGLANRTSFSFTIPLWTFGRIDKGLEAAKNALLVEKINTQSIKFNLVFEIKKYYYGYLFAISMRDYILKTVMNKLDKSIEKTEKNLKQGKAKKTDLYNLNIFKLYLKSQELELEKNLQIANSAFKSFLNISENEDFKIKENILTEIEFTLLPLDNYISLAFKNNEQYQRAKYGLIARKALIEYQKTERYPILFLNLSASYQGNLSKNIDISGVFDNNDAFRIFLAFGLRWSLNFSKQDSTIKMAEAEYNKLEADLKALQLKLPIDIKSAYLELKTAKEKLKLAEESYINGRRWMMHAFKMYMIDSATTDELSQGFQQYANTRREYFNAIYNYNLAIANLSKLVGIELTNLKY